MVHMLVTTATNLGDVTQAHALLHGEKRLAFGDTGYRPSLISSITDAIAEEVKAWQARPLDPIYSIIYLDCIHVKGYECAVRVKAVAIGVTLAGE